MIPAKFKTLKDKEATEFEEIDVIVTDFVVVSNAVHAVAINPNNQQFFNAPLILFTVKMQEAPTIARPSDVI